MAFKAWHSQRAEFLAGYPNSIESDCGESSQQANAWSKEKRYADFLFTSIVVISSLVFSFDAAT